MCGRLNVIDDPGVRGLCETLDIQLWPEQQIFNRYIGAAHPVSIVREIQGIRQMQNATWWLLLDRTETGFKPSKYTSINTRYDSLNNPRKAGFRPYRNSRIVIPVKGFGESEYKSGKLLHCHDMQAADGAMLLAGLAKDWVHPQTGEQRVSCSVITLPPHPKLANIHSKSTPMMLANDAATVSAWLNCNNTQTEHLDSFLQPAIPIDLITQQIAKPSQYDATIGESFIISKD